MLERITLVLVAEERPAVACFHEELRDLDYDLQEGPSVDNWTLDITIGNADPREVLETLLQHFTD